MEKGKWLSLFLFCLSLACLTVMGDLISIHCSEGEEGRESDDRLIVTWPTIQSLTLSGIINISRLLECYCIIIRASYAPNVATSGKKTQWFLLQFDTKVTFS